MLLVSSTLLFYLFFSFSFSAFGAVDDTVVYAFDACGKIWLLVEDLIVVPTELKILIVAILIV